MANKNFKVFAESYITRYTNGGFLTQDTVILTKKYKSDKAFKKLNKDIQQAIVDLFNQGTNVRVIDIISDQPNGGGNDLSQKGTNFSIVIAPEIMPGKTDNNQAITVPSSILEVETSYPNLPKIPKKFMYEFEEIIEPVEYKPNFKNGEATEQEVHVDSTKMPTAETTRKTMQGKSLKKSDTELTKKNIKLSKESVNAKGDVLMESYISELNM